MSVSICETCKNRGAKECRQPLWAVVEKCAKYEKPAPDELDDDLDIAPADQIRVNDASGATQGHF